MGGGGGKVGMGGKGGTAAQATLPQENTAVMARTMGSFMLLGGSSKSTFNKIPINLSIGRP
jgi:hypothetical protein